MSDRSKELHGTSRIVIHAGKLDEFKQIAARCVEIVRTRDSGTIEYDLFLDEAAMECFVHERYRDSAAGLEHMTNIAEVMQPLAEIATVTGEVCGTPEPELRRALEDAGVRVYPPFRSLA